MYTGGNFAARDADMISEVLLALLEVSSPTQ